MRIINRIFHEEAIGICMIIMLALSGLYIYTESVLVQRIGLYFSLIVCILLIGFIIKGLFEGILWIYKKVNTNK